LCLQEEEGEGEADAAPKATGPEPKLQLKELKQLLLALDVNIEEDAAEIDALMAEHPEGLKFDDLKRLVHQQHFYKIQSGRYYVALTLEEAEAVRGIMHISQGQEYIGKTFLGEDVEEDHGDAGKVTVHKPSSAMVRSSGQFLALFLALFSVFLARLPTMSQLILRSSFRFPLIGRERTGLMFGRIGRRWRCGWGIRCWTRQRASKPRENTSRRSRPRASRSSGLSIRSKRTK